MSIIDLISLGSAVLGLSQDGYLVYWNVSQQAIAKEQLPYLASQYSYHITSHHPISLARSASNLFIFTQKEIKKIKESELQQHIKKYRSFRSKQEIPCKTLREENGIGGVAVIVEDKSQLMIDEQNENQVQIEEDQNIGKSYIIYSNKTGKILCTSLDLSNSITICDIASQEINHNMGLHEFATSLVPYRENTLMLVGTSSGRILIVSLIGKKVLEDITGRYGLRLTPVNSMVMGVGNHKFYSLHDNGIVEWSMELQKCLGYYSYNCPYSVLLTERMCKDSQRLLISGGNKYVQSINVHNPRERNQFETSLESVHCLKEFSGKIFCGGSHTMIQVLQSGVTYLILFRHEENALY